MLRALLGIRADPLAYLASAWREYGDVVQFPIPRPPSYLVNDPDAVWQVLVNTGRTYGKSTIQYRSLALVTGDGLLAADTPAWREQRPLVQPAFHHRTLDRIVAHVVAAGERVIDEWSNNAAGLGAADLTNGKECRGQGRARRARRRKAAAGCRVGPDRRG